MRVFFFSPDFFFTVIAVAYASEVDELKPIFFLSTIFICFSYDDSDIIVWLKKVDRTASMDIPQDKKNITTSIGLKFD